MTLASWTQVEALLDEALALPPPQRLAFAERAAGDDEALRHELMSLLAAYEHVEASGSGFLASPAAPPPSAPEGMTLGEGERVGPWEVRALLGRGGMGEVYRAERADGVYDQTVALKLTAARPSLVRRFVAERRILAGLQHPHIARLVDGGVADDGRPYLAMEYVEGVPFTEHVEDRGLAIPAVLRLLMQVCEAVAYAHRRLVVHRDLKPSNILVAEDDAGRPRVKLLDFGIAKLLAPAAETTVLTQADASPMTPAYAAPEQLDGGEITTATDVYALGVLLYEALTGVRPFAATNETPTALLRAMENEALVRPSLAAEQRGRPLPASLRHDLDAIVLKALRRTPEHRYPSIEALRADVGRTLQGLPVEARQGSAGYRMRRFVRRHRVGVAATATGVLALAIGLGLALWQGVVATQARDHAQIEAAKSQEVTDFLLDLLAAADPETEPTDTLTVRTLLAEGVGRIDEMNAQPEVQAQMLDVMGTVYARLGQYDRALPLLRRALAVRRAAYGDLSLEVAESLNDLGEAHREQGEDMEEAATHHQRALALRRTLLDAQDPRLGESLNNLGMVRASQGAYDEAERLYREASDVVGRDAEPTRELADVYSNLSVLYQTQGRFQEAEPLQRRALAIWRQVLGDTHTQVALGLHNLGLLNSRIGHYSAADSLYRGALDRWRALYSDDHLYVLTALNNYGLLLDKKGDYAGAESVMTNVVERFQQQFGPENFRTAIAMGNLGRVVANGGDPARAEALHREELRIKRAALEPRHPLQATGMHNLAYSLALQGRYDEAETLYREALALRLEALGPDHPDTGATQLLLGRTYLDTGRPDSAAVYLQRATATFREALGDEHPLLSGALGQLGRLYLQAQAHEEAERVLRRALVLSEPLDEEHIDRRQIRRSLAALDTIRGR